MAAEYRSRNDDSRARLEALATGLTPGDLDGDLGDGWTVKAALAHLAWWDRYVVALIDAWTASGFSYDRGFSLDTPNLAGLPDWRAVPAEHALSEVVRAARAADAAAAAVSAELAGAIVDGGMPRVLDRSVHRAEHVDQIAAALGR